MKKLFSTILITLLTTIAVAQSQDYTTINVTTPGTLKSILDANGELFIFYLKVTGNIDVRDIICLRDNNPALAFLDLTEAIINEYNGYAANVLPYGSFLNSRGTSPLVKVRLPNNITSINGYAFSGCSALTDIIIPNSVTIIGKGAFSGCSALKSIIIPNSVTTIGSYAFIVRELIDLTIGNSVSYIGGNNFSSSKKLKTITCLPIIPPVFGDTAFYYLESLTAVYVPATSVAAYKASKWGTLFFRQIQANPTDDLISQNSGVKVYGDRSAILVEGTAPRETITLYSITGKLLQTIVSSGERLNIPVDKQGIYLVKTGGKTYKVAAPNPSR
jgi:hypothetical protein